MDNEQLEEELTEQEPKQLPLIVNIFKSIKRKNDKLIIKGFGFTKFIRIKNPKLKKLSVIVDNKKYDLSFKLSKGIPFINGYRFNFYTFEVPVKDLLKADIQNKIILNYDDTYQGRFLFNAFDLKKGKNRTSKVFFENNQSIYLRQTPKNTMYFTVRESNFFDTKEGIRLLKKGKFLSRFLFKRNIIFIYEKDCDKYEESASVLYERLIDLGYKNAYFVLNKNNPQYEKIEEKYKKNIIDKHNLKHIIYFFKSKTFIATESLSHALMLRASNKLIKDKEFSKNKKYVFLQHGVMYMISLDSDMRTDFRKEPFKLHKIVVSSKEEAKHFTDLGGFSLDDLYICGLPKFDTAVRNKNADKIVVMPTWRRWEVNEATVDYTKTKYFKMMKRIIECIPEEYKDKIVMLPHPLMLKAIKNNEKFKEYIPKGDFTYDEILKDCSVLITDYSSISYDAFYRGANVIFYWEEKDECLEKYGPGTKLMLTQEKAFGDVCYNQKELKKVFSNNYMKKQKNEYIKKYKKIVEFDDNHNTDRLIQMLKEDGVI